MGTSTSKEELLYQAVQTGNQNTVKSLHRGGASLEWLDKEGRTPLMVACSHGDLLDMVVLLLQLGANMDAFRSGTHGGFALHHAAKWGLEKTVGLLVSYGANPLAVNSYGQTALDMARSRGHASVVRLLEEKLCVFSGILREVSGFSIFASLAPNLITKKIWAVVLPSKFYMPGRAPEYDLAIYAFPKVNIWNSVQAASPHNYAGFYNVAHRPRSVIQLANAIIEEPNFADADPVLLITDKVRYIKFKFLSEREGDSNQLRRLFETCQEICRVKCDANAHQTGIREIYQQANNLSQIYPLKTLNCSELRGNSKASIDQELVSEEIALAVALKESMRTAREEGISTSPSTSSNMHEYKEWQYDDLKGGGLSCVDWDSCDFNKHLLAFYDNSWSGMGAGRTISSSVNCTSCHQTMESNWVEWVPGDQVTKSSNIEWTPNNQETKSSDDDTASNELGEVMRSIKGNQEWQLNDQEAAKVGAMCPSAPPLVRDGRDKMEGGGLCVVCLDACAEGVCIPCGHLAGCMNCLTEVQSKQWGCPVCRGSIERVIKVYAV